MPVIYCFNLELELKFPKLTHVLELSDSSFSSDSYLLEYLSLYMLKVDPLNISQTMVTSVLNLSLVLSLQSLEWQ